MKNIRFQGKEYLFVGGDLEDGGPIATPEQYSNGLCSYAHLTKDGVINRYRKQIGSIGDIEVLDENVEEPPINGLTSLLNMMTDSSWNIPEQDA